jgi:hypothetical protein
VCGCTKNNDIIFNSSSINDYLWAIIWQAYAIMELKIIKNGRWLHLESNHFCVEGANGLITIYEDNSECNLDLDSNKILELVMLLLEFKSRENNESI